MSIKTLVIRMCYHLMQPNGIGTTVIPFVG